MKKIALLILSALFLASVAMADTVISRPNGHINGLWAIFDEANIDDAVTNPTPGDGSYIEPGKNDDGDEQKYTLSTTGINHEITQINVVYYAKNNTAGFTNDLESKIVVNGVESDYQTTTVDETFTYYTTSYYGIWKPEDFQAQYELWFLVVDIGNDTKVRIDVAYTENIWNGLSVRGGTIKGGNIQ